MPDVAGVSKHIADAVASFGWPPLLPLPTAIRYTSRSRWTIGRAVAAGQLVIAGHQGRSPVFRREDLDRWLLGNAELVVAAPSAPVRRAQGSADALTRIAAIAKGGSVNRNG